MAANTLSSASTHALNKSNWKVTGIISNAINPGWVIVLTFPLITLWRWLDKKGLEPSTPAKMVFGMVLTALAFFVFFIAAKIGEASVPPGATPTHSRCRPFGCLALTAY